LEFSSIFCRLIHNFHFPNLQPRPKEISVANLHEHVVSANLDDVHHENGSKRAAHEAHKAYQWQRNFGANGQQGQQQDGPSGSADTATGDGDYKLGGLMERLMRNFFVVVVAGCWWRRTCRESNSAGGIGTGLEVHRATERCHDHRA
jgi:hypothetical protein